MERRNSLFSRDPLSGQSGQSMVGGRPRSAIFPSSQSLHATASQSSGHSRTQSLSPLGSISLAPVAQNALQRSNSQRMHAPSSTTFAPKFIKSEELERNGSGNAEIEGENDFSGKRYVWLRDPEVAFVRGWVVEDRDGGKILVQCDDGTQREVEPETVDKVNPAKFDKAEDMAELTHLNEPSVVHNLQTRYQSDLIYTYSGLFLVTVNPYCPLPIYSNEYINMYKGRNREDNKPHIFAMSDKAFRNLVEEGENQSILVTGESGAGKTENTKKVIQYLAAVAHSPSSGAHTSAKALSNLSQQILRANPILEAFGNAQTVRNNNSSRFGKFIRIEFTRSGQIAGAYIDWYLLEKSRVVRLNQNERNYHVFYQLLRGANKTIRDELLLGDLDVSDFIYTRDGNDVIAGISDHDEWVSLIEAFQVMGFSEKEQLSILKTVAAVLHLGNVTVKKASLRADQASLSPEAQVQIAKVCQLLGIAAEPFVRGLLHPRVKAGREWVEKAQTPEQVRLALDSLAKGIYERGFGDLVSRINRQLDRTSMSANDSRFIGVLDIAGFEIFEENSFEQLCINYTNEKLQQFFNHHMFVLEQEEYTREQIEWKFIDFGRDLQPTIDLIELSNPIGVFSCLDEDCVMPKATDKSFTEKLHSLWDRKTPKYRSSRLNQGFILTHYAADVEYSTEGWLEKNKDPLNDNITKLLAASEDAHVANLFTDCADVDEDTGPSKTRVKRGLFRTVAQRHKEQLSSLMMQLNSTHPHFVRCIIPNHKKRPKLFSAPLVLDQLRCNGVLEGIRIARTGFPNRLPFAEFRQRYEVLCKNMPKGYLEGQAIARIMLEKLELDKALYRVGLTKVFFRAGVLAELEERRDALIREIMIRFQSVARGFVQRRLANKRLYRAEATRIIRKNFQVYLDMAENPWWRLFVRMKPLLGATRSTAEVKRRDEMIQSLEKKMQQDAESRQKLEDDRRRTDMEMQRIQQTLESERALAFDKEEIHKRLQEREIELTEKLAETLEDQDELEKQLDELMIAKHNAEQQAELWRNELEQASQIIVSLEAEKSDLVAEISKIEQGLAASEKANAEKSSVHDSLSQEVKMLKSHLALKERKMEELQDKLLKTDNELDLKLATATKNLEASNRQVKELLEENRLARKQISELSSTSTGYEDLVRRKESEILILKKDLEKFASERQVFDDEKQMLSERYTIVQSELRDAKAEMEAMRSQKIHLEREAADAKNLLEAKISEDAKSGEGRKMLDEQIKDLKAQLFNVQTELGRERQSRNDVQMLGEHKYSSLKTEFDTLNEAKITIEKEMYLQQDVLRRAKEARSAAEADQKHLQTELSKLRERFVDAENSRIQAESAIEQRVNRTANDHISSLSRELEAKDKQLSDTELERTRLSRENQHLSQMVADSDLYKLSHDQHKERLERELVTIKGRLTASENDNRSLLNKIQQKNLDIARSNSRAGETQRVKIAQLQAEKAKVENENRNLHRQLDETQMEITSMEKQKEKLSLSLEDLNHEIANVHKAGRNAEKTLSATSVQLAEANRNLETEKQLKSQAQANTRKLQEALEQANEELRETHGQLVQLHKIFNPETVGSTQEFEKGKPGLSKTINLAQKLEAAQEALRIANERCARSEEQLIEVRRRYEDDLNEMDTRHSSSKRALLEEINQNQLHNRSPKHYKKDSENIRFSNPSTPTRRRLSSTTMNIHDSARSDRATDGAGNNKRMDLAAELEMIQNQLQQSELQNRQLQSQLERSTPGRDTWQDDSPSVRRVQKLERENNRLHDLLDDSAKKVSSLEKSIQSGHLSLKDVQTKSHEELYDLINSQEQSRRSLLHVHNNTVAELTDAKARFEELKRHKSSLEVELRDAHSELREISVARDEMDANRSQLLRDNSDLQIRLDAETSKLVDVSSSLNLYKSRADEYFSKLEQAEIAVLKASRAEQFAKSQAREAEETCATIMAGRKEMDSAVEELQRQVQHYEERVEDMAADLEGALQSKKRLQHELEDYRSQRAIDIEDKETLMEQTRKKYQTELSTVTNELEIEKENVIYVRTENTRLREELEGLRSKWDDEVLNSSSWAKEKARLETTLQDVSNSREEAVNSHNEAQTKIISLLSQVRNLRTSLDDVSAERDLVLKEKRALEARLTEAADRLEDLARGDSPSMRNAAGMDRELLQLKSELAQQQDVAAAAVGKMRRAEALAAETQKDIVAERESNVQLHKDKTALEKSLKEFQLKLVDLETKSYSSTSQDVRFLHGRVQELEKQLEEYEQERNKSQRSVRNVDRTVRDLQIQIERREKTNSLLTDEINKSREKVERLLQTIEDLQSSESENQLQARRAERDLREEREKALRLERELEGWKSLRVEKGTLPRNNVLLGLAPEGRESRRTSLGADIRRMPSNTKGFL